MDYAFYFGALALTLTVELLLAALLGLRRWTDFALVFAANLLTNPLVNVLAGVARLAGRLFIPALVLLEIGAVLGEWALYRRLLDCRKLPPFVLSLILNGASVLAGVLLFTR